MQEIIFVSVGKRSYVAKRRVGSDNHFGAIAEVLSPGYGRSIATGVEIAFRAETAPAEKGECRVMRDEFEDTAAVRRVIDAFRDLRIDDFIRFAEIVGGEAQQICSALGRETPADTVFVGALAGAVERVHVELGGASDGCGQKVLQLCAPQQARRAGFAVLWVQERG